jgi:hypothetical protein
MFFLSFVFLFSTLICLPLKSSYKLPDDFLKITTEYILLEEPSLIASALKKHSHHHDDYTYINKKFSHALYSFAFTIEPSEVIHLLKVINDLKESQYLPKESLSKFQIQSILKLSPKEYQEHFFPTPPSIKQSPSQKRRARALRNSKDESPLRNIRNYYHLLSALQEAIEFLLSPHARTLLEKNFVIENSFHFNKFIQYFGHKNTPLDEKLRPFEKTDRCVYFEKNKYGNHHFYEVKARTLRLFKKILKLYLQEMSCSHIHTYSDEHALFFPEKKKKILLSLKKAYLLLQKNLSLDARLINEADIFFLDAHEQFCYDDLLEDTLL